MLESCLGGSSHCHAHTIRMRHLPLPFDPREFREAVQVPLLTLGAEQLLDAELDQAVLTRE
jgi:hypothetical protein